MKRFLLLIGLALTFSMVYGQVGSAIYTPYVPPRQQPPPTTINYYSVTPSTPPPPPKQVYKIDEEVFVIEAYSTKNDKTYDIQIKEIFYSDGTVYQTVVGIKMDNAWKSVSGQVGYIAEMLSASDLTKEMRETLLLCNEYATHIASYNDDLLLIGLKK